MHLCSNYGTIFAGRQRMGKYRLQQVGSETYYIPAPVNIGVIHRGDSASIIDSGNDSDSGRKIRQLLENREWRLEMICNTHSNADHIGGNNYLQRVTGCRIGATVQESPFITFPELEPAFLWGGFAHRDITGKFLRAEASEVTDILQPGGSVDEAGLQILDLPGHFHQMVGFISSDRTCFLADALFPRHILDKYHICFIYDVNGFLQTLDMLEGVEAELFIPSHCKATDDITGLISSNRDSVHAVSNAILEICSRPLTLDNILTEVFRYFSITMSHAQYVLVGSTVRSYVSYLMGEGALESIIDTDSIRWCTVGV